MKALLLPMTATLFVTAAAYAGPKEAVDGFTKRLNDDIAANALTKPDADELKREIGQMQAIMEQDPNRTKKTNRDLERLSTKISKDFDRKEAQAKAEAAQSPTP